MFIVGIDENGLGPRLGPLVATSVVIRAQEYDRAKLRRIANRVGIDDSKETSGFCRMQGGEGVALALLERSTGEVPKDADNMLDLVGLEGSERLRAPCPAQSRAQCWSERVELPMFGGVLADGHRILDRIERAGISLLRARCAVLCPGVYNRALGDGRSKLRVDLSLFERLLVDARRFATVDIVAICGMVGGIRNYEAYFAALSDRRVATRMRKRGVCTYDVGELGEVRFEVDADSRHMPVALASMLGKYVREVLVARQNRFYRRHDGSLPLSSGYYDPVTTEFIERSLPLRRRLGVVDECFLRSR